MSFSFKPLADKIRRAFGSASEEVSGLKPEMFQRSGAALLHRKRLKVAVLAVLFGVVSAVGLLGDPVSLPWLIQQMRDMPHARVAGEAFSLITGADLALLDLELRDSPDYDADFPPAARAFRSMTLRSSALMALSMRSLAAVTASIGSLPSESV